MVTLFSLLHKYKYERFVASLVLSKLQKRREENPLTKHTYARYISQPAKMRKSKM